jgi:hypothetical protein
MAGDMESQWARGQVRTSMSDPRCPRERGERRVDIGENSVGGIDVVFRDLFPDLVEICERVRMEGVAAHPPDRRRSLFSRSLPKASSPSIGVTRPLLRSS